MTGSGIGKERTLTESDMVKHVAERAKGEGLKNLTALKAQPDAPQLPERADLIIPQRIGRVRWNHINPLPLKEVADRWINRHAVHAIDGLAALKDRLERTG